MQYQLILIPRANSKARGTPKNKKTKSYDGKRVGASLEYKIADKCVARTQGQEPLVQDARKGTAETLPCYHIPYGILSVGLLLLLDEVLQKPVDVCILQRKEQ